MARRSLPTRQPRILDLVPFRLTPREREVVGWLGEDITYVQIGCKLKISVHGIRKHARNVQEKLGVRSRHAAVARLAGLGYRVMSPLTLRWLQGAHKGTRQA